MRSSRTPALAVRVSCSHMHTKIPIVHSSWERASKSGYIPTYSEPMEKEGSHPLKGIWITEIKFGGD